MGAMFGLIPARKDGLNLAGEGGVRFRADITALVRTR